jgi:hypothetical protein
MRSRADSLPNRRRWLHPWAACGTLWLCVAGCEAPLVRAVDCAASDCGDQGPCSGGSCDDASGAGEPDAVAPLVVDDFEDADPLPSTDFDVWIGHTYNPGGQYARLSFQGPGHDSSGAMYLDWRVDDAADGRQAFPGAGLETHALNVPIDLSHYSTLSFAQRFEPGIDVTDADDPASSGLDECTTERLLTVITECDDYPGAPPLDESGRPPGYESQVQLSATWATTQIALDELHEPTWRPETGVPLSGCLSATTGLYFQLQTGLGDGQCSAGRLVLDDITFR